MSSKGKLKHQQSKEVNGKVLEVYEGPHNYQSISFLILMEVESVKSLFLSNEALEIETMKIDSN